ncbi:MAG TPA: tRNA (N(6)-L-threonylcarbamoyladenosine(37)-C(2))-methylthiotransferase MtaB, partial [Dehalococcoidia bacterium]
MSESARPATAAILTLGCKLNIADSEAIARRLREAGWRVVDRPADAEAVIVNSCSVTHVADQKSRHLVRLARRVAPKATVALTGCLLETASPQTIDALGADLAYRQPAQLALAERIIELRPAEARPHPGPLPEGEGVRRTLKTRAFIAAQQGCNDVCAFCIIPRTRGRERSKSVEAILAEARAREAEGAQEVVITGTQLGAYGRDRGVSLHDLMGALLAETAIPRIRMSSVQPQDLTDELIELWRDPRLCRHFHLALQSGSETVLRRMRRRYSAAQYRAAVDRLREAISDVAITTDVIVGFSGETEAELEESYAFCREMAFAGVHVFPYSQRQGTVAFKLPDQVPEPVKKERVHRLLALAGEMSAAYRRRFLGTMSPVLWEKRREDGRWEGLTDTYVRV